MSSSLIDRADASLFNPQDPYPYSYQPLDYHHQPSLEDILFGPDPRWYMELFLTIPTQSGYVPFRLWPWMHQVCWDGLTDRELMLKSRDTGSSTFWVALALREMLTHPGANTIIAANKEENAINLIDYAKVMVKNLPPEIRPELGTDNTTTISFPKLGNKMTAVVGSDDAGRSGRCKILICTELAFWKNPAVYWAAVTGALVEGGKIYAESTANTQVDLMHDMWMDKSNGYQKRFFGLWANPTHTPAWYVKRRGDVKDRFLFIREYPETPQDAFTGSADTYFDQDAMLALGKNVREPVERREFDKGQGYVGIWKKPQPGRHYIIGGDVAGGTVDKSGRPDWSHAYVIDYRTSEQVASIHCRLDDAQYAVALAELGREYNYAFIGVEANNQGLAVLRALQLQPLNYKKLYERSQDEDLIHGLKYTTKKLGWLTTAKNRPIMMMRLADAIRSGEWFPYDEHFVDEAKVLDRNTLHAPGHGHDDAVYAAAVTLLAKDAYNPMMWSNVDQLVGEIDVSAAGVEATWTRRMPWNR